MDRRFDKIQLMIILNKPQLTINKLRNIAI